MKSGTLRNTQHDIPPITPVYPELIYEEWGKYTIFMISRPLLWVILNMKIHLVFARGHKGSIVFPLCGFQ